MADGLNYDADDLVKLAKRLEVEAPKALGRATTRAHRVVAVKAAGWTRFAAAGGTRRERRFASTIRPGANQRAARVVVQKAGATTFWGAKKRTGWYAADKYAKSSGRQHPPWVGNTWSLDGTGGPYVLAPTIRAHRPAIEAAYVDANAQAIQGLFETGSF